MDAIRIVCPRCRRGILTPRDAEGREIQNARTELFVCGPCKNELVQAVSLPKRKADES